jgi:hypothetical protein
MRRWRTLLPPLHSALLFVQSEIVFVSRVGARYSRDP